MLARERSWALAHPGLPAGSSAGQAAGSSALSLLPAMAAARTGGTADPVTGHGATAIAASGGGEGPIAHPGGDTAGLAAALRALEARKALLAGAVAALAAPDEQAAKLFDAALADPGARWWPFDLARVHLLYGERLRRAREIIRSRYHLQLALAAFERLGAPAWADRAAAELAATGPTRQHQETGAREPLTPQELQVAELAAAGLTNKEIAGRLYMSHRTVGAHLYRIFPKLDISSRAALRDALGRHDVPRPAMQGFG